MKWRDHLVKKIVVEEYYLHVELGRYGTMQFRVRYVTHNGYTVVEGLPEYKHSATDFIEWLGLRIDMNTRYDRPHWWHPIRLNREKKLTMWAVEAIEKAYKQYHQENVNAVIPD